MPDVAAVVLAGGEGRRLGGRSKPDLQVGGRRLLDIVLSATAGASPRVVVAGPEVVVPASVLRVQEDPPRSGPAAGILAGLAAVTAQSPRAEWTLVLACDLPGAPGIVDRLVAATRTLPASGEGADGAILTHPDGTREWLAAVVRTEALAASGRRLGDAANRSARSLLGTMSLAEMPTDGLETGDIDTMEDYRRAEQRHSERPKQPPTVFPEHEGTPPVDPETTAPGTAR